MSENFDTIKKQISESIMEHNRIQTVDAILYNGAIFLAITATSSAAIFADDLKYAKLLSGIGALLIALERALSWGGRWRYERQMRNNYLIIQAKINYYENLPATFSEEEKKKIFQEVYADLYDLRKREGDKPGSGSQSWLKTAGNMGFASCGLTNIGWTDVFNLGYLYPWIEKTALKIADNIDTTSINLLKKYSFVKRGELEFWQRVSADSSLYAFSIKTIGDTSELTVNRPYNFIKDFSTNYPFDTSNHYEFKFSKLNDTIRKVVKVTNQANEIKNDTLLSAKQVFPEQDPFVTIIQLNDFKNKYNIVGTSYYSDIGDIMVFWLSPQFKLTYLPDTLKLNPKSKKFWLDEFNKGKQVKVNWSLLKVYEW